MYKKHHWQVAGPTFYYIFSTTSTAKNSATSWTLLRSEFQTLGGISIAMAPDVAETTLIPRLPRGRQEVPVQLSRLLHAHEVILLESRSMAKQAGENGDDGTNDSW
jgi:starvation-inducible DNA-binding protein